MNKLVDEIRHDVNFVRSHTLQPSWYKILKVFILIGFLAGYALAFGAWKTGIFAAVFFFLALLLHLAYRAGSERFTRPWLDFRPGETGRSGRPRRIGAFYYAAVFTSALVAAILSQALG
jgi:hypothetical protein